MQVLQGWAPIVNSSCVFMITIQVGQANSHLVGVANTRTYICMLPGSCIKMGVLEMIQSDSTFCLFTVSQT